MGSKMVMFIDNDGVVHNFRQAFFSEDDGLMPPRELGVYMLLDRNDGGRLGPGTHRVLYVGQSETGGLRNRMFLHAMDPKYADRYRGLDTWPVDVLFVIDADIEIAGRGERSLVARRIAYEDRLHGLFVPPCSDEFPEAKRRGEEQGCVSNVTLDFEVGTLQWALMEIAEAIE